MNITNQIIGSYNNARYKKKGTGDSVVASEDTIVYDCFINKIAYFYKARNGRY